MFKVAYNACYGGFSLSSEAVALGKKIAGPDSKWNQIDSKYGLERGVGRHDATLIVVIEKLGDKANGMCAKLKIEEIDTPMYRIDEYDGYESVETPDSVDWVVIGAGE